MFKSLYENSKLSDPTGSREKAIVYFEQQGLPTRSNEAWKYTSLKHLSNAQLELTKPASAKVTVKDDCIEITCADGCFNIPEIERILSPLGVTVKSISAAEKDIRKVDLKDSFYALNSAFYNEGLYLKLTSQSLLNKPVVVNYLVNHKSAFVNPRIYIEMNEDSTLEFAEIFSPKSSDYLLNSSSQINMGKRSSLKAMKYFDEPYTSSHIDNTFVWQSEASTYQCVQMSKGSRLLRQNLEVAVEGSQSLTDLRGISLLENENKMDNYVKVHHVKPESTSRQAFRSILKDNSHYVFQGNIRIEKEAQKTDSDQVNRNLMLGQKCRVDTKPQLDVFADDVRATHGATIGQLNPDEKFYLESRAISPEKALSLLSAGFALDLLSDLKSKWIKNFLKDNL